MRASRNPTLLTVAAALALLFWGAGAARGQGLDDGAEADTPAGQTDDVISLLEGLTPEQLQELIKTATQARLKYERQQVIAEIDQNIMYRMNDDGDVQDAVKMLQETAETQRGNIDRIIKAFARVDVSFAKPYKLFCDGKYASAADELRENLDPRRTTYLSAAKHFLYAEALARSRKGYDAVDAYEEILVNMPDRISFAAAAAMSSARAYENLGRSLLAMEMYGYCLTNYGLTIDPVEAEKIAAKVDRLYEIYKDPINHLAAQMGNVEKRLTAMDSGKETQKKQKQIVALLEDLIKTAEEQQQQGQSSGKKKGQKGQGQGKGVKPKGSRQPSSPAQSSFLVPGRVERPTNLSTTRPTGGQDDWASMLPRERIRIQEAVYKNMSERYRRIISDYYTRLAEQPR